MRRIVALLFAATAACGLIGSTAGYSAMFCDTLDAAAIFCDSFDSDASPWASVDSGNPIVLSIEEGPKTSPVSPPNVLHVIADGGPARANRLRYPFTAGSLASTTVCTFDVQVLAASQQLALIAWLEVESTTNGAPLYGAGTAIGPAGIGPGTCIFQADAGQCLGGGARDIDAGEWAHVDMTFGLVDGGITTALVHVKGKLDLSQVDVSVPIPIPPKTDLTLCVGLANDQLGISGEVLIDNVFCR